MKKLAKITIEFPGDSELSQVFDNVVKYDINLTPEYLELEFAGAHRRYERTGRMFISINATTDAKAE